MALAEHRAADATTGLVVLSRLPATPSTLMLRSMGTGRTLKRALAELERLPEDARERHVALPALLSLEYRAALLEQPARTAEDEEFLMDTQDIVQQLKDEGRHEGRHEATQNNLLTIYRTRFGSVPRKVRVAVERTRDDAVLARWIEVFVVRSAAEIAAAVAEKKA
ncbi:MAG: hypothetical protein E6J90_36830 [Deltaproteobacteria bacterium]|nr:MAG: hypothetical protein E6J90_36830 [Deltaproteobacteria bacterium]